MTAPPISSLRELEYAVTKVEENQNLDDADYLKWLFMLISPGSSLGVRGFILDKKGWRLSPAYDLNPVTPANGLHLNITELDDRLDFDLAMQVISYFRISKSRAEQENLSQAFSV